MRRACVVGSNISHSRSPVIHGYWINEHRLDACYEIRDISHEELPDVFDEIRKGQLQGCNVTVPFKEAVTDFLDASDPPAKITGSVNTIYMKDRLVRGTSTDGSGYMAHLVGTHPGIDLSSTSVLLLGAGGAARSILGGLVDSGAKHIFVSNRTPENAVELAGLFPHKASAVDSNLAEEVVANADLIINTTSLGTGGKGAYAFDMQATKPTCIISDIVYAPLETPMLAQARKLGRPTLDGLGMLLHQAVKGFELWFGVTPDVTPELRRIVEADLQSFR